MGNCPPLECLQQMAKQYPGCWEKINAIRKNRGSKWEDVCFVPSPMTLAIIETYGTYITSADAIPNMNASALMAALAAWRQDKRIYRIPKQIADTLFQQAQDTGIPPESLRALPSRCIFLDLAGWVPPKEQLGISGAFVHQEKAGGDPQLVLNVLLEDGRCRPFGINVIPGGTIWDGLSELHDMIRKDADIKDPAVYIEDHYHFTTGLVEIFLWYCSHIGGFAPDPVQEKIYRAPRSSGMIKDKYREVRIWGYAGNDAPTPEGTAP